MVSRSVREKIEAKRDSLELLIERENAAAGFACDLLRLAEEPLDD
jgi:hypothetical protein